MTKNIVPFPLPPQIVGNAILRDNEYGWQVAAFPDALRQAEALNYACLGGQFQFRLADGIYEMYWLNADAGERAAGEAWSEYCHRSCSEVLHAFNNILANANFTKEAANWATLSNQAADGFNPLHALVFVAYFMTQIEIQG